MTNRLKQRGLRVAIAAIALGASSLAMAADARPWADLGRPATEAEVKAWDIDVRADFKGLPPGKGSVEEGIEVWEAKCTSCHGIFGESNEVFTPLVGGTTEEDVETGRVAALTDPTTPQRTTMMKVSQVSTLWDYINRAMPWNAPKSLTTDEVYAVLAYLLNLSYVVDDDFVLSNENIAEVQQRMPNRNGTVKYDGMWRVAAEPDVQGSDCMKDCETKLDIRSFLPDYARNAHGNLAEQNRVVGPTRGADTAHPATKSLAETQKVAAAITSAAGGAAAGGATAAAEAAPAGDGAIDNAAMLKLAEKSSCLACHGVDNKLVGPAFKDVAKKYAGKEGAAEALAKTVKTGGSGNWGAIPMPPNPVVSEADARKLVDWVLSLPH